MATAGRRIVAGVCPLDCPDTCQMRVTVEDGVAVDLRGERDHPFTRGFLCRKMARYLDRVYTPLERAAGRTGGAASLAARFAAKEAVLKLIGTGDGVDPREIEVGQSDGRPVVRLAGRAADLAAEAGLGPIDLSLSHSGDHALAVAVALTTSSPDTTSPDTRDEDA